MQNASSIIPSESIDILDICGTNFGVPALYHMAKNKIGVVHPYRKD